MYIIETGSLNHIWKHVYNWNINSMKVEELNGLKLTRLGWLRLSVRFISPWNQSPYFGGKSRWKKKIKKWNHFVCFSSVKMSVLFLCIVGIPWNKIVYKVGIYKVYNFNLFHAVKTFWSLSYPRQLLVSSICFCLY